MKSQKVERMSTDETSSWALQNTGELLGLPIGEFLARLNVSLSGLSSEEVERRLEICGPNELAQRKKRTTAVEFLSHFKSPLIIILLLAGLISGFFGEIVNAAIIFSIVLVSVVLDFYQESKAEKAAKMLKEKVTTTATVLRDSARHEIKLSEIVPGDIVCLSAGDMVPADARAISAKDFFVNQSALTGESFPVGKTPEPLKAKTGVITEWNNGLFSGTSVVSGTATAVVTRTGNFTEYGRIAKRLVAKEPETEYERGLTNID